jgi:hypothetical protein
MADEIKIDLKLQGAQQAKKSIDQVAESTEKLNEAAEIYAKMDSSDIRDRLDLMRESVKVDGEKYVSLQELAIAEAELLKREKERDEQVAKGNEEDRKSLEIQKKLRLEEEARRRIATSAKTAAESVNSPAPPASSSLGTLSGAGDVSKMAQGAVAAKLIFDFANAAGSKVKDLNAELVELGGKSTYGAEALEVIFNPIQSTIDAVLDAFGALKVKEELKLLRQAKQAADEARTAYEKLAEAKAKSKTAAAINSFSAIYDAEAQALSRLNDQRERAVRVERNREGVDRGIEDIGDQRRIAEVRRKEDGAAETVGVARIQSEAAQRDLQRSLADVRKPVEDAQRMFESAEADAERLGNSVQGFKNLAETAEKALRDFSQKVPLIGASQEEEDTRFKLQEDARAKRAAADAVEAELKSANAKVEAADGALDEERRKLDDNIRLIQEQAVAQVEEIAQSLNSSTTENAREVLASVEKTRAAFDEANIKVPAAAEELIGKLKALIEDQYPDEQQLVPISNAILAIRDSFKTLSGKASEASSDTIEVADRSIKLIEEQRREINTLKTRLHRLESKPLR